MTIFWKIFYNQSLIYHSSFSTWWMIFSIHASSMLFLLSDYFPLFFIDCLVCSNVYWYSHFIVEIVLYLVLQINIFVCGDRYRLQLEYSSEVELLSKSSLLCENIFAFTHILVDFVCHIGFSI